MNDRRVRLLRATRVTLGIFAAAMLIGAPSAAGAPEDTPTLAGFQGSAQADGVHVFYNPAGVLPIGPPVDLGAPDAYATIASGPATFARASVADPGDLLANPDALLQQAAADYPAGSLPRYPFRAVASSGTEPHAESNPAPGLTAVADASQTGSVARAATPALDAPSIIQVGTATSRATTSTDGSTVTVNARTQLAGLDVFGLIKVGSVITDVTATSDGTTTTVDGGTVVADATIAGTPVTIDASGVKPKPGAAADPLSDLLGAILQPAVTSLNDLLTSVGIHITVASPEVTEARQSGQLTAGGLLIDFELSPRTFPALSQLLDSLPSFDNPIPGAPGFGDLLALAKARHLLSVEVARGVVTLSATSSTPEPDVAGELPGSGGFDFGSGPGSLTFDPVAPAPGSSSRQVSPGSEPVASTVPIGAGIGATLLLVLLAQPLLGGWLGRGVISIVSAGGASSCPWEER